MTQIHIIAEGEVTFKSILFDPDSQPPEQFKMHGQKAENIKPYIRRVFVPDDLTDMMPSYHSFVKGVIDSDDPPLNASRSKREKGRQLEALTEEEDSGDRQDDGVHDDQHQKFTLPIHETTNPVKTTCLSIAVEEQTHGFETYLIQVEDYIGTRSTACSARPTMGMCPSCSARPTR
jgi:HSP90 family molecular chaperone